MPASQADKANAFKALHEGPSFVIANAWDGGSARILGGLGFKAIASSSGAQAGTFGRRDGAVSRDEALAHCAPIVNATDLPVSADLESGFGDTAKEVAETYRRAAAIGLVGATIEDARPGRPKENPLYDINEAADRVAAAVEATSKLGFPFLVTARAEGFLRGNTNLDDAIKRLQAYSKAGAQVMMAPGLPDISAIKAVCVAVPKPFNFMVGIPGKSFSVAELTAAGVKRISLATSLYRAAMSGLIAAAREVQDKGTFGYVGGGVPAAELSGYMQG